MADEGHLLRLIAQIYDAAANPGAFEQLSSMIAREFRGDFSLVYVVQNPKGKSTDLLLSATSNFDDWAHTSYTRYYRERDVWSLQVLKNASKPVVFGQEVIEERALLRSEIYNDWYEKVGIHHALAGLFPVGGDLGVVTVSRPRASREFDEQEAKSLSLLVPHLQRAVQMHRRLTVGEQQRALTSDMLERLSLGIFVLDGDARVLFANAIAERMLEPGEGLMLTNGILRVNHSTSDASFRKTVRAAAMTSCGQGTGQGGFVAVPRLGAPSLSLLVSPYRPPGPGPRFPVHWHSCFSPIPRLT